MTGIMDRVRGWDSFAKTHDDFRTKTVFGGIVTLLSTSIIVALLVFEYMEYRKIEWKPELVVDKSRKERMTIDFDIEFPRVPCFALTLDVMDAADQFQNNMHDHIVKTRVKRTGQVIGVYQEAELDRKADYCGSCYAAETIEDEKPVCCNSCSAVFAAYEMKRLQPPTMNDIQQCIDEKWNVKVKESANEGCKVTGWFKVNKVSGNFHFAPGRSFDARNYHLHDMRFLEGLQLDFSHKINYLSFGEHHAKLENPLDGHVSSHFAESKGIQKQFTYYIKVVASDFVSKNGKIVHTNQFAVTQNEHNVKQGKAPMPSAFFYYDISPMIVIYTEFQKSLASFLTGVCAIIGGVYTISAILDAIVFHTERRLFRKQAIGKTF